MKLIWKTTIQYKNLLLINFISVFGFALAELGIPTLIAQMIDRGVNQKDPATLRSDFMIILIIAFLGVLGTSILAFTSTRISTNVTYDLRKKIFDHLMGFSHSEMEKFGIASMITRTNNDAYQIMLFLNTILRSAMIAPVMMIVCAILIIKTSLPLSSIIFVTIPIIIFGVIYFAKVTAPISEKQQKALDSINRILRENMSGIRVIRAFNKEKEEEARFQKENAWYTSLSARLFKWMSCSEPVFFFLMNLASVLIYYFASIMISNYTLQIGQLIALTEYLFHAMMSVLVFCMVFMMYPRANVSAKRIQEVLDTKTSIQDQGEKYVKDVNELTFSHVSFHYAGGEEKVLDDLSFTIKKGEKLAVIGSTGSGKSTLVKLIPRFYEPTKGEILINGINYEQYDLHSLRKQIAFMFQKPHIFKGTIRENISFGRSDASREEIEEAATLAQARSFILEKGDGFEEEIDEEGANLSGGQKQRLSIARALLKQASINIYDDSFSALDFKTDAMLRKAIEPLQKDSIFIIVAQRVGTILDADHILVLNEGKQVGFGRHEELLKTCPIYKEIVLSQISEEEVEKYVQKTALS
ncbi:ABC transporter ATP-binding protein [Dubosiella newyorkensis]|uniref:ABC transporter ATP-binding protein n=1 Tax=Dubosiella newyorkensis TaxID=1862672 RepID=UPI0023F43D30|nr:ABC transporter ATP-binding protein [Dubosiella newyorkensis]